MMDIDLINNLRNCAEDNGYCNTCDMFNHYGCYNALMKQAADRIEILAGNVEFANDYIEFWKNQAEKAKDKYQKCLSSINELKKQLRESETDNAKSVTKAEWEYHIVPFYCRCPSCGTFVRVDRYEVFLNGKGKLNFCPNCGVDMREES